MAFFTKYNVGSGGGGGVSDHGALTGLTDNDHPQYVPPTDWTPPPFQYKDADEITVLAGRYHKGGHRLRGHYQNLTGMASYWDVSTNFDVDIDATYSAGSTSGMLGGKVNSSWYAVFMVDSDELLLLPFIRVDAVDYDTSNSGKTTINPAAHADGTTTENGFLTADDQWNTYRLMVLDKGTNHGTLLTVEDCANGTPDEIIIDGDQTAYVSATDWFLLIPPSATDCCYLGAILIDDSGDLYPFLKSGFEVTILPWVLINGNLSASVAATDLAAAVPPTAGAFSCALRITGNGTIWVSARMFADSSGTETLANYHVQDGDSDNKALTSAKGTYHLSEASKVYTAFVKTGDVGADSGQVRVLGWLE